MNRVSKILFVFLLGITFLTGCGNKEVQEKTMICTRNATIAEGTTLNVEYTVTYQGDYVKKIYSNEKISSDNTEYLNQMKTMVENTYAPYKDLEYYDYNIQIEGDTLTSQLTIDYDEIDTDKMIEIDSANATLIKDGKVKVEDIKAQYNNIGAICEEQ